MATAGNPTGTLVTCPPSFAPQGAAGVPGGTATCPPAQGSGAGIPDGGIRGNGTCPPTGAGAIGALGGTTCPPFAGYGPAPGSTDANYFRDPTTGLTFETNEPPTGAELPPGQTLPPGFTQDPATGALVYSGSTTGGTCPPAITQAGGTTTATCPPAGGTAGNALGALGGVQGNASWATAANPLSSPSTPAANPNFQEAGPYGGVGVGGTSPGLTQSITSALGTLSDPATITALQAQAASNPQIKQQLAGIVNSLQGIGG